MSEAAPRSAAFGMIKRYAILGYGASGTMLDVGLMVLGSLLVGLAVAVLLAGFELVNVIPEDLSSGAMLASALVIAVVGLFCLGVASEGPLGRGRRLVGFKLWEVGIGRTLAVFGVGFLAVLAFGFLSRLLDGLPAPLHQATRGLEAVGIAGMTVMPLLGVPLSLLMRWGAGKVSWMPNLDIPAMFVVWAVAAMATIT
ncbi:MAG: hypothetical protein IH943_05995 [Acidobacteria bacterium]|nr:hypothetical protein [Acidobacteriota bacterium]MCZ6661660.1 hypothetical protein [Actinomycetota bacterium]